jgi:protein-disulfide isomerase
MICGSEERLLRSRNRRSLRLPRTGWFGGAMLGVCILVSATALGQGAPVTSSSAAVFEGQPIYEQEYSKEDQAQLRNMRQQLYAVEMRALHKVLDKRLIEAEAKRKGITVEQLFQTEIVAKVPDPPEDKVREYYTQRQSQYKGQPFEAVRDQILHGMKDLEIQKSEGVYVQSLLQKAVSDGELSFLLTPPKADLSIDATRLKGDTAAPITIVEFSDFSCSECKAADSTMNTLLAKYPGKIKISYRDFPLRISHPQAQLAAEASRCAGEQGMYWEYHDLLFANADKLSHDDLMADARKLKLDETKFGTCLSSGNYGQQVEQDLLLGNRVGVVTAPSFFVAGTFVSGAQPAAAFEKIIDDELAWAGKKDSAH